MSDTHTAKPASIAHTTTKEVGARGDAAEKKASPFPGAPPYSGPLFRVSPRVRAKVEELLAHGGANKDGDKGEDSSSGGSGGGGSNCLLPYEHAALLADWQAHRTAGAGDTCSATSSTSTSVDDSGESVRLLSYSSLRAVCRHSLFSIKDLARQGLLASAPPPPLSEAEAPEPTAELKARREYLKRRAQEKAYNLMVHQGDVDPAAVEARRGQAGAGSADSMAALTDHSSVAVQMIVAPLAAFAIAYYAGRQTWKAEQAVCMVWGLLAAISMLLVEGILYVARASRSSSLADKQQRRMDKQQQKQLQQMRRLQQQRAQTLPAAASAPAAASVPAAASAPTSAPAPAEVSKGATAKKQD